LIKLEQVARSGNFAGWQALDLVFASVQSEQQQKASVVFGSRVAHPYQIFFQN